MKKLLVVLVVALLALALVACGSSGSTTAKETNGTTPATGSDTTPATGSDTTPAAPGSDTTPATGSDTTPDTTPVTPSEGVDILWGDFDNAAIIESWQNYGFAIENHHAALDYKNAFVIQLRETEAGIYDTLVITTDPDNAMSSWEMNEDFKWVVIIDDERIEIDTFSVYNNTTSGYIRLSLGDWTFNTVDVETEGDNKGLHGYDIKLEIIDINTDEVAYYAWFSDPTWYGKLYIAPPQPIEIVVDPDRNPGHVAIPDAEAIPTAGPTGFTNELYNNLFDGKVTTKLCTEELKTGIEWNYTETKYVVSYSLVGAGDDASYTDRVPIKFTLYGSTNGKDWQQIDKQELTAPTSALNYEERNFALDDAAEYQYFKLVIENEAKYQLSGIILYTEPEYIGG